MAESIGIAAFVKAPRLGAVKTRLAAEIGPDAALAIYRSVAERVIATARSTGRPITVWFDPPEAGAMVEAWLGADLTYRPQRGADLGERMGAAFEACEPGTALILIGVDVPDLDRSVLDAAALGLERASVVLGPAVDGGYYLVAGRPPMPDLFRAIPWSTTTVLERTRARLRDARVDWLELPTLRDVDTAADARAAGLLAEPATR